MHFLRLLCTPFSFHWYSQLYFLPPPHTNFSFYFYTAFTREFLLGFVKPKKPKKPWEHKAEQREKISCRRWTGSTSKTPPAVPSLQAQHPSSTSGKVLHFQGGVFPLKPSTTVGASKNVQLPLQQEEEEGFSFPHNPNPPHKGLFLWKCTLCKALTLLQDFYLLLLSTAPLIWYLVYASYPLSTHIPPIPQPGKENNKEIAAPEKRTAALTFIFPLNCQPEFIQPAPNPHGSSLWNCIISPLLSRAWFTFPGETEPLGGASHKSAPLHQECKSKLEPDVTVLQKTRVPIMESLNESKDFINCH